MSYTSLAHFSDYRPTDFGWGARDPEANPALLTPFTYRGVSFGDMHVDVVRLFTALLDELVPQIPAGLVAGQCGCYNPNSVTVSGERSFHTYGIAIDVNWGENPMYASAHPTGPHTLPSATSGIARKYGCEWGGDWSYPQDWMHIEVHLSPPDARAFTPPSKGGFMASLTDAQQADLYTKVQRIHSAALPPGPSPLVETGEIVTRLRELETLIGAIAAKVGVTS